MIPASFIPEKLKSVVIKKISQLSLYTKISEAEYNDVEANYDYDSSLNLVMNSNSSFIAVDNGKYFRLDRGQLSDRLFETLSVNFKDWLN